MDQVTTTTYFGVVGWLTILKKNAELAGYQSDAEIISHTISLCGGNRDLIEGKLYRTTEDGK